MEVFKLHYDFRFAAFGIVADGVREDFVHQTFEAIVFAIAEELGAVLLVAYLQRVAAGQLDEIFEDFGGTVRYGLRLHCWRAHETSAFEPWKCIIARAEKACEAEGEEVGGVARTGECIAGYLKLLPAY